MSDDMMPRHSGVLVFLILTDYCS